MLYRSKVAAFAALLLTCAACDPRYSSSSFHLPAGDVERGKAAFVELGCHSCHEVSGVNLPAPSVHPTVPVTLGGEVDQKLNDAYLVTSMLDPSFLLALYPRNHITSEGKFRMPGYADRMSTRQMIDIVVFLQSRYVLRQWSPEYYGMS